MMPLDPDEFIGIQEAWQELMPNTCDILRPASALTDDDFATLNTNVPCSFFPASSVSSLAQDVEQNNMQRAVGDWVILLPYAEDIDMLDRVQIIETQQVFEIVSFDQDATYSAQRVCKATLVE